MTTTTATTLPAAPAKPPKRRLAGGEVYRAIIRVMARLAKDGLAKTHKTAAEGKYMYRGIDDVYNALASILAEESLCMLPRAMGRDIEARKSKAGGDLYWAWIDVEFDLVSAADGSMHTIRTVGEAMDSSDKGSNKAMSSAYKYAAVMAFCIPTKGDHDTEATTHALAPVSAPLVLPPAPAQPQASLVATPWQVQEITKLKAECALSGPAWTAFLGEQPCLKPYPGKKPSEVPPEVATELIAVLRERSPLGADGLAKSANPAPSANGKGGHTPTTADIFPPSTYPRDRDPNWVPF